MKTSRTNSKNNHQGVTPYRAEEIGAALDEIAAFATASRGLVSAWINDTRRPRPHFPFDHVMADVPHVLRGTERLLKLLERHIGMGGAK